MSYWVIMHGDPEASELYWCGYNRVVKDHMFSRDKERAIRFCREIDAERAGVGLTKGIKIKEMRE